MPCEQCRKHLTHYLRNNNVFRATNPITTTGKDIRNQIRLRLLHLHNNVNIRNKIAEFREEDLTLTYGNKPRDVVLWEVSQLLNEVKAAWEPLRHTVEHKADYSNWKQACGLLIALLSGGPN